MTNITQFFPDPKTQLTIDRSLSYLSTGDAQKFRKKFREQQGDEQQLRHTCHELLAGVFVARQGYEPHYEPEMDDQTPDWHFVANDGRPSFFMDVVNFHIDSKIEVKQDQALRLTGIWCGMMPNNDRRLYPIIQDKAGKYKELATRRGLPFVVFINCLFTAGVQPHEIEACLYPATDGLFHNYPTLTGVCHFDAEQECFCNTEAAQAGHRFVYLKNVNASHADFHLDDGLLPIPIPSRSNS